MKTERKTMKNGQNFLFTIVLAITLAGGACEGPTGPQGPQGEQGLQGEQGPEGPEGPEGSANVIYSEWIEVEWHFQDAGQTLAQMYIGEPRVTQEILDSGATLMYFRSSDNYALPLPYIEGNVHLLYAPVHDPEQLIGFILMITTLDDTAIDPDNIPDLEIRYVIIPGGIPAGKMPGNFWQDYEAVVEYLGIPD